MAKRKVGTPPGNQRKPHPLDHPKDSPAKAKAPPSLRKLECSATMTFFVEIPDDEKDMEKVRERLAEEIISRIDALDPNGFERDYQSPGKTHLDCMSPTIEIHGDP